MLEVNELGLGVFEIIPTRFGDDRGYFTETYNKQKLEPYGISMEFVQDNQSYSVRKGVLRGLHYQLEPYAQDKLVRVLKGRVYDVAVDIRQGSSTFGKWVALELTAEQGNQILIPKGFAHGFVTLEEHTIVAYKVSDYYSQECDRNIRYDDPDLAIKWPILDVNYQLSDKDTAAPFLQSAQVFE
ncbi:dTDP-4-dehydrorhamnose 3,5-epimerase [Pseudochrobactrum sp. XF203]|uniref:dTDP-4-dehydrorhamnose 3,5-epimerase n=1 Tax=Pseudochrobactrum sp. XF203 TaxID=2879116 RepID=UPI001CE28A77|nr:dTDP-4-dehydrorhamnose 3,5-epimerase [Pseudochrobactrum sp. XF203]UCA47061.1 dTDP-4-dehydrorhamnose 3,5-epimerase [Pseudochrobactrum sp. XF203]